jgi:hypothetical protein
MGPCRAVACGTVLEVGVSEKTACRVWFQADMWLKKVVAVCRRGRGMIVPHDLHPIADAIVPEEDTPLLLVWLKSQASS